MALDATAAMHTLSVCSALTKFSTLDKQGRGLEEAADQEIARWDRSKLITVHAHITCSTHQNVIGQVSIHTGDRANATVLATTGMDGVLVLWDVKVWHAQHSHTWSWRGRPPQRQRASRLRNHAAHLTCFGTHNKAQDADAISLQCVVSVSWCMASVCEQTG